MVTWRVQTTPGRTPISRYRRLGGSAEHCLPPSHSKTFLVCPQLCIWYVSVEEGHVITLSFKNFSLETQDVCEFDYVEVHDGANVGAGRVLGR